MDARHKGEHDGWRVPDKIFANGDPPMNLMPRLAARAEAGRPVRCALIGAGKFGFTSYADR